MILVFAFYGVSSIAQDPKAIDILKKVNAAISPLENVSYSYTYHGSGKLTGHFSGAVKLQSFNGQPPQSGSAHVRLNTLDDQNQIIRRQQIATTRGGVMLMDHEQGIYRKGTFQGGAAHLFTYAYYAVIFQYMNDKPFITELEAEDLTFDGEGTIAGVRCWKVSVNDQFENRNTWYFGQEDYMIYGQVSESVDPAIEGGFIFEVRQLDTSREFQPSDFSIDKPDKFQFIDEDNRPVAVGQLAPDWVLYTPDGSEISPEHVKGKKVILDFWASWCKPCWQVMPVLDEVAAAYDNDKLAVIGVNVWESPQVNPGQFMKEKSISYDLLIDKDARVASSFKIGYLPMLFVIDEGGVIQYISNGFKPNLKEELIEALR